MAVSIRAIDRSAVFIVPMKNRFCGSVNSLSGEYCRLIDSSRYSSRKYSSPNTLARFARLISSMIRMYAVLGLASATGEIAEWAGAQREGQGPAAARLGPEALEEVLVGV